jgi:hypothetical protein
MGGIRHLRSRSRPGEAASLGQGWAFRIRQLNIWISRCTPGTAYRLEAGDWGGIMSTIDDRLDRIEQMLAVLVKRETIKDYYEIEEFARLVGKAAYTCREWARLGRIRAEKRQSGRGAHPAWLISHEELLRYRRDGLLADAVQRR